MSLVINNAGMALSLELIIFHCSIEHRSLTSLFLPPQFLCDEINISRTFSLGPGSDFPEDDLAQSLDSKKGLI